MRRVWHTRTDRLLLDQPQKNPSMKLSPCFAGVSERLSQGKEFLMLPKSPSWSAYTGLGAEFRLHGPSTPKPMKRQGCVTVVAHGDFSPGRGIAVLPGNRFECCSGTAQLRSSFLLAAKQGASSAAREACPTKKDPTK